MRPTFSTPILFAASALAAYSVVDDYSPNNFASKFDFFTGSDPTNGYVNYVDYNTASSHGLYSVSNNQVYMGVDHNNTASGRGRDSVRISSKNSYQHGLIVLDLAHMPASACGTWPAFWLLSTSATWPNGGEVDIIEGVNTQNYNTMAVHTNAGCSISSNGSMTGKIVTDNCDVSAPGQATNQGCAIKTGNTNSYGDGFNAVGGGAYATEWTSSGISIWFFPRSAIPADLASGTPNPSAWGLPMARFAGACDWDEKVVNQQIVFDITFCGYWAGNAFSTDATCSLKASTCQAFVQSNPSAFAESFWSINSLKVYQNNGPAQPSTTSISSTPTSTFSSTTIATTTTSIPASTMTASTSTATTLLTSSTSVTLPGTTSIATTSSTYIIQTTTTSIVTTTVSTSSPPATIPATTAPTQPPSSTSILTSYPNTFSTVTVSNSWSAWSSQPPDDTNTGNWSPGGSWGPGSRGRPPRRRRDMS
ncbi:hypothetical protein LTR70_010290 [Exophiala xenobiotica]|uniref:GH16 domain-containing protein n=1 Tax=Lithohypha guttulata TaxID=1690604 RepID=A0ABR0JUD8_9EURO|nr:hypothetical protein LTR24_010284 [Lithohypha guttulata]KAK5309431.1 hypothetical protein LTR70_010290 [Exophiala xenobiotica]